MHRFLPVLLLLLGACSAPNRPVWRNSLGMAFVTVPGIPGRVCTHETRVGDYARFVRATGREWPEAGFPQTRRHPAVNVSWHDARAFCAWLGAREGRCYRLPTDAEWSRLVRLPETAGVAPNRRAAQAGRHPWGPAPLHAGAGNYCDEAFGREYGEGYEARWLAGYDDGHAATAPVGSYAPDAHGLHDLGGNVWEWCEDAYDPPAATQRVLRGASWRTGNPERLWSSYRGPDPPSARLDSAGFRIIAE